MKKQEQDAILNDNPNFENKTAKASPTTSLEARVTALEGAYAALIAELAKAVDDGKATGQLSLSALEKALKAIVKLL